MKKLAVFFFVLVFAFGLIGCVNQKEHTIRIVIPAGSQAEFIYSEEEITTLGNQFTIKSIDVPDKTSIVLKAVETEGEDISSFFIKGEPMVVYAEEGTWYKIGIAMQNPTDEDIVVVVNIENAKVRIK